MPLHLLIISLDGKPDELSAHPDHDTAWTALLRYIDERWSTLIDAEPPADDNARVEAFFLLPDSFYLIGEVVATIPGA